MKKRFLLTCLFALSTLFTSCTSVDNGFDHYWVTSGKLNVHKSANRMADVIGKLKFGDEILGHESNLGVLVPKQWLEIKYGDGYGYVERSRICDKATIDKMKKLAADVKESQVQGTGLTGKKTPLRVGPSKSFKLIERIKKPANIEVFDRVVVDRKDKDKTRKEVWHKVRLEDGRVGYTHSSNVRLVPPREINQYTSIRKTVAWQELGEKRDPETGAEGKEYIVAYLSQGTPINADFSRIELYTFDPATGRYGTALARSGLMGKLPLAVKDAGDGKKIIEIRQIKKKKPGKLLIQEYSFPSPIKMVKEYEIDLEDTH